MLTTPMVGLRINTQANVANDPGMMNGTSAATNMNRLPGMLVRSTSQARMVPMTVPISAPPMAKINEFSISR